MHRARPEDAKGRAKWDAGRGVAVVQRSRGKFMSTMGYAQFLFPEEAVFLADRDEIELVEEVPPPADAPPNALPGERKLDGVEIFGVLDRAGIDLKCYTAYAVLREQRFQVYRRGAWRTPKEQWGALPAPGVNVVRPLASSSSSSDTTTSTTTNDEESTTKRAKPSAPSLTLAFDAYMPMAGFSKNNMGKPAFSLAVVASDDSLPPVAQLRELIATADAGVPVRLCIVGDSSISFIELSNFDPRAEQAKRDVDVKKSAGGGAPPAAASSTSSATR